MHQSSDSGTSNPSQPRFQLPMHSKFHYSAVLGSSCLALVSCFRSIKEGRKENLLQSAKALLLCTLLVNTVLLLYALCGGWIVGVLGSVNFLELGRLVLLGGALLSLLFLAALYYLDSLLLVGVFAVLVSAATAGTAIAAVRLQYPPLWLEVVICGLMVVSSLMLLLEYLTEERELKKMKEREMKLRRRSSSASSAASASSPPMNV